MTEFLPISSSGHLVLAQSLLGLKMDGSLLALDVSLHFGTLMAVLFYFFKDISSIFLSIKNWFLKAPQMEKDIENKRLVLFLCVATLPAIVVGLFLKDFIEELFSSSRVAAYGLLVTAFLLWTSRYTLFFQRLYLGDLKKMGIYKSFFIGVFQAIAIIPGISRSGSTIVSAMFLGLDPKQAARFSFLMAIPAISGSMVLSIPDFLEMNTFAIWKIFPGVVVSFCTGLIAIKWLISLLSKGKLYYFSFYCLVVGVLSLVLVS